jgi:hypothetical protein
VVLCLVVLRLVVLRLVALCLVALRMVALRLVHLVALQMVLLVVLRKYIFFLWVVPLLVALSTQTVSRTRSFIRFSELNVLIIRYDKMVSHMMPHVH